MTPINVYLIIWLKHSPDNFELCCIFFRNVFVTNFRKLYEFVISLLTDNYHNEQDLLLQISHNSTSNHDHVR